MDSLPDSDFILMRGISKRFGDVLALDRADFHLKHGEVHALLGENGAGKTTLMNVLYGLYRANEGEIRIDGKRVSIDDPRDALSLGISMVHQHFRLVSNFTALENVLLGSGKGLRFEVEPQKKKLSEIAQEYGLTVDMAAKVKALPVGSQQRVEILKVLMRDPRVLVLDEPTSSLTPQEADVLLSAVKKLAAKGMAIVFITHKVREVMAIADRITVLKGGKVAGTLPLAGATEDQLVELMMGGKGFEAPVGGPTAAGGGNAGTQTVLIISDLTVGGAKGVTAIDDVSLTLNAGEIFGLAGVSGNGQRELAEAITAVRKARTGSVKLLGNELTRLNPRRVFSLGVCYIPEDRMGDGILPTMSVAENVVLGRHHVPPFARGLAEDYGAISKAGEAEVKKYSIKTPGVKTHAGQLSGGNIQKVLIARALMTQAKLVVAHNPTRGLDFATTNLVLRNLLEQKKAGAAVFLISEDLDELMLVSDRIGVLYRGKLMGVLSRSQFDKYEIGSMMAGKASAAS